jgi:hypothetical protein
MQSLPASQLGAGLQEDTRPSGYITCRMPRAHTGEGAHVCPHGMWSRLVSRAPAAGAVCAEADRFSCSLTRLVALEVVRREMVRDEGA